MWALLLFVHFNTIRSSLQNIVEFKIYSEKVSTEMAFSNVRMPAYKRIQTVTDAKIIFIAESYISFEMVFDSFIFRAIIFLLTFTCHIVTLITTAISTPMTFKLSEEAIEKYRFIHCFSKRLFICHNYSHCSIFCKTIFSHDCRKICRLQNAA